MNQCVLHTTKCAEPTTTASARIARYLANKFNCVLYDGQNFCRPPMDRVFYVNSMGAFADPEQRILMADVVRHCKQLIYVQNDYTIHPISQTQKVMRDERGWSHDFPFREGPILWTTVPEFMCKPQDSYVNWNMLTYQPVEGPRQRIPGLVYWGSYRQNREESFKRYFATGRYPITLLCAPVVFNKFQNFQAQNGGHNLSRGRPWKQTEELAQYEATVYIEDDKQHGQFHSLANRFYESLSAGLATFICRDAVSTFEKAGLAVEPEWVVSSAQEVERLLPYARGIASDQRTRWANDFRSVLDAQVAEAYGKL